jgi:hypothetical protein
MSKLRKRAEYVLGIVIAVVISASPPWLQDLSDWWAYWRIFIVTEGAQNVSLRFGGMKTIP